MICAVAQEQVKSKELFIYFALSIAGILFPYNLVDPQFGEIVIILRCICKCRINSSAVELGCIQLNWVHMKKV